MPVVRAGKILVLTAIGFAVSGCAHQWVAGPNVTEADYIPAKAKCSIMARHGGNSIEAYGSTKFVAGALIGNAIGNALMAKADFDDCMQASGFLIADGQHPAPVAYAAPPANGPAPGPLTPPQAYGPAPAPTAGVSPQTYASAAPATPQPAYAPATPAPAYTPASYVAPASAGPSPAASHTVQRVQPADPKGDVTYVWPQSD